MLNELDLITTYKEIGSYVTNTRHDNGERNVQCIDAVGHRILVVRLWVDMVL